MAGRVITASPKHSPAAGRPEHETDCPAPRSLTRARGRKRSPAAAQVGSDRDDRSVANAIARRAPPGLRKQSPGPRSHTLQITRIHKPTRTRSTVCGRQRIAWRASARRVKPSQRWCLLRSLTVASAGGAGRSRNRRKSGLGRPSLATLRGAQTRAATSRMQGPLLRWRRLRLLALAR